MKQAAAMILLAAFFAAMGAAKPPATGGDRLCAPFLRTALLFF